MTQSSTKAESSYTGDRSHGPERSVLSLKNLSGEDGRVCSSAMDEGGNTQTPRGYKRQPSQPLDIFAEAKHSSESTVREPPEMRDQVCWAAGEGAVNNCN